MLDTVCNQPATDVSMAANETTSFNDFTRYSFSISLKEKMTVLSSDF